MTLKNKSETESTHKERCNFQKTKNKQSTNTLKRTNPETTGRTKKYDIIAPVNKEQLSTGNTFTNPVIILRKGESLKIVLDARYLNSMIDESKCN